MEVQPSAQSSSQKENCVNTSKRLLENTNWTFPVVRYFTWKLKLFSNILSVLVIWTIQKSPYLKSCHFYIFLIWVNNLFFKYVFFVNCLYRIPDQYFKQYLPPNFTNLIYKISHSSDLRDGAYLERRWSK